MSLLAKLWLGQRSAMVPRIWKASQLSCELKLCIFRITVEAILLCVWQSVLDPHSCTRTFTPWDLYPPAPQLIKALSTFLTETTFPMLLCMDPCHQLAQHCSRWLQLTGHCFWRVEPAGTSRLKGHACVTYVKPILCDFSLQTTANLSQAMTPWAELHVMCNKVVIDVGSI